MNIRIGSIFNHSCNTCKRLLIPFNNGKIWIVWCFVFSSLISLAAPIPPKKAAQAVLKVAVLADTIERVENLSSKDDSVQIGESIIIKVKTAKNIDSLATLYIDGLKVTGLKPWETNDGEKILYFTLNERVVKLIEQYSESSSSDEKITAIYLGIGNETKIFAQSKTPLFLEIRQKIDWRWLLFISAIILGIAIIALCFQVLKDDNNLYYSLSRTQLFYWSLLIVFAYLYISFTTGTLPLIPGSILAIVGIGVATTAATRVIENRNKDGVPIDESATSDGFLLDILSDGSSINIQRFQSVIFNLFFGIIFIQKALGTHLMPQFEDNVLLLLGISSGTYAGLKITEATKQQNQTLPQVNTDNTGEEKSKTATEKTAEKSSGADPVTEDNTGESEAAGGENAS